MKLLITAWGKTRRRFDTNKLTNASVIVHTDYNTGGVRLTLGRNAKDGAMEWMDLILSQRDCETLALILDDAQQRLGTAPAGERGEERTG